MNKNSDNAQSVKEWLLALTDKADGKMEEIEQIRKKSKVINTLHNISAFGLLNKTNSSYNLSDHDEEDDYDGKFKSAHISSLAVHGLDLSTEMNQQNK